MTIPWWPTSPPWPDEPGFPYPPARPMPRREGPVAVPVVDVPSGTAQDILRSRRRLFLTGRLDGAAATDICAELMALDGRSADAVEVIVNSDGGPLADVLAVLDVIASMRARVDTTCVGRARGTAAIVLACGTGRRAGSAHAVITLRVDDGDSIDGPAERVGAALEERLAVRQQVVTILAAATGRPADELDSQLDHGPPLDQQAAATWGLIDRSLG
jgi:ATP-dependent Clp protease protease subunit